MRSLKAFVESAIALIFPSATTSPNANLTKQYAADGTVRETDSKAGMANAVPIIASHSAENIGTTDCKQVFVEKK